MLNTQIKKKTTYLCQPVCVLVCHQLLTFPSPFLAYTQFPSPSLSLSTLFFHFLTPHSLLPPFTALLHIAIPIFTFPLFFLRSSVSTFRMQAGLYAATDLHARDSTVDCEYDEGDGMETEAIVKEGMPEEVRE